MAKNFFKRYIWLVDLLSRRGYIPLKEISDEWHDSSGLNVPPVSLSNVPGVSETNVPPISGTNVPGISL